MPAVMEQSSQSINLSIDRKHEDGEPAASDAVHVDQGEKELKSMTGLASQGSRVGSGHRNKKQQQARREVVLLEKQTPHGDNNQLRLVNVEFTKDFQR